MTPANERTKTAIRKRRSRERQRLGIGVFPVEARYEAVVEALIRHEWLAQSDADDPAAVITAFNRMIEEWVAANEV